MDYVVGSKEFAWFRTGYPQPQALLARGGDFWRIPGYVESFGRGAAFYKTNLIIFNNSWSHHRVPGQRQRTGHGYWGRLILKGQGVKIYNLEIRRELGHNTAIEILIVYSSNRPAHTVATTASSRVGAGGGHGMALWPCARS